MNGYRSEIRRIMIAVNTIDGVYEMIARKIGVKNNTLALLYALDDGASHSQKEICEEWFIPKTTINTIIKECVEAGYIRLDGSFHKKEKTICLTESGRKFAGEILGEVYALEARAVKSVPETASPLFAQTLENFTSSLKEEARSFVNGQ